MGDIAYAQEKLRATTTSLADSEGALRERLFNAYMSQGMRTPVVDGGQWYPDLADRITALHARLTSTPAVADEGTIAASIAALSDDEVREVVREILDLESCVNDLYWRERGARL